MRWTSFAAVLLLAGLLLACTVGTPMPKAGTDEDAVETQVAEGVSATLTAVGRPSPMAETDPALAEPSATPTIPLPNPTPTPLPPAPTPVPVATDVVAASLEPPVSEVFPEAAYLLADEATVDAYTIRFWSSGPGDEFLLPNNIITISAEGQRPVEIEMVSALGSLNQDGTRIEWRRFGDITLGELTTGDITGDGYPDLVLETYSGGAHCCFSSIVYELGPSLDRALQTREGNCGGDFEDLDGDGVLEFITCDDIFAYVYCSFAGSPLVKVILAYQPGQGYLPASSRFAHLYADDIIRHTEQAKKTSVESYESPECQVLPLVLDYLYTGQPEKAWSELDRLYTGPDVEAFGAEIEQAVTQSPLFVFP